MDVQQCDGVQLCFSAMKNIKFIDIYTVGVRLMKDELFYKNLEKT